jgi:hypothetical protein
MPNSRTSATSFDLGTNGSSDPGCRSHVRDLPSTIGRFAVAGRRPSTACARCGGHGRPPAIVQPGSELAPLQTVGRARRHRPQGAGFRPRGKFRFQPALYATRITTLIATRLARVRRLLGTCLVRVWHVFRSRPMIGANVDTALIGPSISRFRAATPVKNR